LEEVFEREDNRCSNVSKSDSIEKLSKKKVNKSTRGMPWLSEAMKDVISCDKLRVLAHTN
jgi:hypothetical protein